MVLMALVDGRCKFMAVDIGAYGKEGDSGVFKNSVFGQQITSETFPNVPSPSLIPGTDILSPHVFLGDSAFTLSANLLKPFSQRQSNAKEICSIFNYRLSRARRTVENAFGILSQVFRMFLTPLAIKPEKIDTVVLAACLLHNLLRDNNIAQLDEPSATSTTTTDADAASQTSTFTTVAPQAGGRNNKEGIKVRMVLAKYFKKERDIMHGIILDGEEENIADEYESDSNEIN